MAISSFYASMNENKQYLAEIAVDNEVYLVNNMCICKEYEDIFNCLKHRVKKT